MPNNAKMSPVLRHMLVNYLFEAKHIGAFEVLSSLTAENESGFNSTINREAQNNPHMRIGEYAAMQMEAANEMIRARPEEELIEFDGILQEMVDNETTKELISRLGAEEICLLYTLALCRELTDL